VTTTASHVRPALAPLLDINQAAERMNVSTALVRKLVFNKRIPYFKIEGCVRFDPVDLEDWIASRRIEANVRGAR
jgi:excisionase family DNA binding protein